MLTKKFVDYYKGLNPIFAVLVLYSIPFRDIGQYSKGGERTFKIQKVRKKFTEGIGDYCPIVIYEPDSIPHLSQFHHKDKFQRIDLMSYIMDYITNNSNILSCILIQTS